MLLDSAKLATYQDAVESNDSLSCLEAMRYEQKSMDDNHIWNLVNLPSAMRDVECKLWVANMEENAST
jgi:hypothetical protein